ncbi:MAG: TetR/AcrR family transcriptional regulator [Myxococcota bacterium]
MASGRERSGRGSNKRERILSAAVKVFARSGFYNAKISEIAREAGVADGTIYLYFDGKDNLLISAFEDRMKWLIERLQGELKTVSGGPLDKMRECIRLHLSVAVEAPDLAEFITVELRQSSKFVKEYDNPGFMEYLGILRDIFVEGQKAGVFRADLDPRLTIRMVFGALDEVMLILALSRHKVAETGIDHHVDQVEKLLIDGLLAPQPEGPSQA